MRDLTTLPYNGMEHMLVACWQASTPVEVALAAKTGPASTGVKAVVNHGRWLVECPTCKAAQFADQSDPRFMCNCCANAAVGGAFRPVTWPSNREAIETVLRARPADEHKNWTTETLAALKAENKKHGVA